MNDLPAVVKAPDQKYCSACARLLHVSAASCPACGATQGAAHGVGMANQPPLAISVQKGADQKFCIACGQILHQSASTCPKCGALLPGVATNEKSRTLAAILAILLGGFGVHKFYVGNTGMGVVYLIFFWTWVPAIVALVEGVWYLTLNDDQFHLRVVSKS